MLLVENFFGGENIANFLGLFLPGHGEQPIEVVAADRGFRGHGRHQFEALQFLNGFLVDFLAHAGSVDFFLQLVDFVFFAAAELFLDGLEFFVEVVLFLSALHLALDPGIDVAVDVELFELDFENVADAVEPLDGIGGLEKILLFINGQLEVGGNGVGQTRGIVDARRGDHGVVVQALRELDKLFVEAGNFRDGLLDLRGRFDLGAQQAHGSAEKAFFGGHGNGARPLHALDENLDVAVRQLHALHDIGERAHGIDFFRFGIVDGRVMLRGKENLLVAGQSFFERADAGFAADDERGHLLRENDHVAHRHHGYALNFLLLTSEH